MMLATIGASGQQVDILAGGDVNAHGRLLSVAEVQAAMRALRAAKVVQPEGRTEDLTDVAALVSAAIGAEDTAAGTRQYPKASASGGCVGSDGVAALGARRVSVVAAHSGAGASAVALAIAEAQTERRAHLIELCPPARSGLVAAANAELGADPTGRWRRGSRNSITIDRRAAGGRLQWPAPIAADPRDALVVFDVGLAGAGGWASVEVAELGPVIVVCRPTVPGLRLAEQLLGTLPRSPAGVAVIGDDKWPREARASSGLLLTAMRSGGAVVPVPPDRHLEVTGLTTAPLPAKVTAAGRALLALIDAAHQAGAATNTATAAPRMEGTAP